MRRSVLGFLFLSLALVGARAQNFATGPCPQGHDSDSDSWFGTARACEMRSTVLPLKGGHLGVSGENGGIEIVGEDRSDIALEVRVTAQGPSHQDAEAWLHEVRILTADDNIHADGPKSAFRRSWSVDYKLRVPRRVAQTELHTTNGSIHVANLQGGLLAASSNGGVRVSGVSGDLRATSTNGGLVLEEVGGSVHAETTNGPVRITLAGNRWQGSGLFAKSTNGGISIKAPDRFAAHLTAETTNGGISVGFPLTLQGKLGHHIDTDLNGGGPPVHLETTNGGISVERS